jgi:polar amino acid transport system permease protein
MSQGLPEQAVAALNKFGLDYSFLLAADERASSTACW